MLVSFANYSGGLRVAHCRNILCKASSSTDVETGDTGGTNSVTVGADGLRLIAYNQVNDLGVAHCSNPFCVPYFRRR